MDELAPTPLAICAARSRNFNKSTMSGQRQNVHFCPPIRYRAAMARSLLRDSSAVSHQYRDRVLPVNDRVARAYHDLKDALRLPVETLPQPDETTCGPTCLHAVYRYWGDREPLET